MLTHRETTSVASAWLNREMPPNTRIQKKALKFECEWGPCQESFSRMENFCKHAEGHLSAGNMAEEDEEEAEGEETSVSI